MEAVPASVLAWLGILFCISQSAMFSGLNLALLSISRLRLEVEVAGGNPAAIKILVLRKDSHFLLTTILWGNVAVNVLLTLLSKSVMAGALSFFFSTFLITFMGEIIPQAYFSRHALRMGALLAPVIRLYQIILYPVAKPSALMLDWWLGEESIRYFTERDLHRVIREHIDAEESDVSRLEGIGAMNFLSLDDVSVTQEGENVDPDSVIPLPIINDKPVFPSFERKIDDGFLLDVHRSGKKWVIIVDDKSKRPSVVLNANAFLRDALLGDQQTNPYHYCHRPILIEDSRVLLGKVLTKLKVYPMNDVDDVIDDDLILIWSDQKRVITGADILGRLLHGITLRDIRPFGDR